MRKRYAKLSIPVIAGVVATGALAVLGVGESAAQNAHSIPASSDKPDATYLWTAELVAFDEPSNTVTVKAPLVTNPEATDISALQPGDHAVITWYGLWTAAGVRAVERRNTSSFDRMTMPIEYVSSDLDGRYLLFRVPIPAKDAAAMAKVKAGTYVTATSPLRANSAGEAVISIKSYNDAS